MQIINQVNSTAATVSVSNQGMRNGFKRKIVVGFAVALLGAAAMVLSTAGTSNVPANLAVSSIDGNIIIAFDKPASALKNSQYRIDCSAVSAGKANAWADADSSPAVVSGVATGEEYDCHASMKMDAGASKSVRVRVMGGD